MKSPLRIATLLTLVALLPSLPAGAAMWTIKLHSGGQFQTRYQPQYASWDANRVVFLSEVGNLVSVAKSDIESISSDIENRGFGKVLNTTTVMLGQAPNDSTTDQGTAGGSQAAAPPEEEKPYSVQQFVEPSAAQGIPGNLIPSYGGGTGARPVIQMQMQAPPATPPPAPTTPPSGQ